MKTKLLPSRGERWDELKKEWKNSEIDNLEFIGFYNQFHNFLKQAPEKWMFVPCDDNGNVLEKPDISIYDTVNGDYKSQMEFDTKEYQQALDRVIFDGFVLDSYTENYYWVGFNLVGLKFYNDGKVLMGSKEVKTLADLSGKVYLNENGIKDSGI